MKKRINIFVLFITLIAVASVFVSCGEKSIDEKLVGEWMPAESIGYAFAVSEDGKVEIYTVDENGDCVFLENGSVSAEDGKLEIIGDQYSLAGEYLLAGSSLLVTTDTGLEYIFGRTEFFPLEDMIKKDPYAYINLGSLDMDLSGFDLNVEVTDQEIEVAIKTLLETNPNVEYIYDRAAQANDKVNIDFIGYSGLGITTGMLTDIEITLDGSSEAEMEGFDAGIIGLTPGKSASYTVKTLNDSGSRTENNITVTLNYIYKYSDAEYNDEFVSRISDMKTTEEYNKYLRELLVAEKTAEIIAERRVVVWNTVKENSEFINIPDDECEKRVDEMLKFYEAEAEAENISLGEYADKYFEISEDELREKTQNDVVENIKKEIMFSAVLKKSGIDFTDELYEEGIAKYADAYSMTSAELEKNYGRETLEFNIIRDLAEEYIISLNS